MGKKMRATVLPATWFQGVQDDMVAVLSGVDGKEVLRIQGRRQSLECQKQSAAVSSVSARGRGRMQECFLRFGRTMRRFLPG